MTKSASEILEDGWIKSKLFSEKSDAKLWQVNLTMQLTNTTKTALHEALIANLPTRITSQETIDRDLGGYNYALDEVTKIIKDYFGVKQP